MQPSGTDRYLGIAALALLIIGCIAVLHPFLSALLWAAILVSVTWGAFTHLDKWLGHRRNLSALAMTCVVSLVVIAPFAIVALGLADNATQLSDAISSQLERGLPDAPAWLSGIPIVGERLTEYWQSLAHDTSRMTNELKLLLPTAQAALLATGKAIGSGLMQLTLSVFIAFFLFRDGEAFDRRLSSVVSKIAGQRGRHLLGVARSTVTGVVYGILGTALAQGVLAGIGFAIAGVPGALLLGLATFFLSVVPVGPPLIWGGAAVWLFQQGETGWAIFMVVWGGLVISMVDNIIKPIIISRGSSLPFVLVFLGVLGGAVAFGLVGVFLGPTLLAVGYRLLNEWSNSLIEPKQETPSE
jgi:predicted PurR-regulated permease PerM